MIEVTLKFSSVAEAARALASIAGTVVTPAVPAGPFAEAAPVVIAPTDRPDVGKATEPPMPPHLAGPLATAAPPVPPAADPAAVFGGAVAQAAPPAAQSTPAATPHSAATVPTVAPTGVELDKAGLPWDGRIHAGSKTKTADGNWRKGRSLDPAEVARVEAELRAALAAPPASTAAVAAPAAPVTPPAPPATGAVVPPGPPAQAPQAAAQAPAARTFGQYMAEISSFYTNRPVDAHTAMSAAMAPYGLTNVSQLATRPDLIDVIDQAFRAALA